MNTAMRWSVLVIMMICALGSCKPQDCTNLAYCRLPPYAIVGQPTWIQFLLSSDPKEDKKDVYIRKGTDSTSIHEAGKKEDFIFEGIYNLTKKDLDIYIQKGYMYGGIDEDHFLTLYITKVGSQHEGIYVAEDLKRTFACHLKMLANERFFTMHEQDRNAWMQVIQYLIAVVIVTVIASALPVIFFYLHFRKRSTASNKKTGEEETSQDDSGKMPPASKKKTGEEETSHDSGKMPPASKKKTGEEETSHDDSRKMPPASKKKTGEEETSHDGSRRQDLTTEVWEESDVPSVTNNMQMHSSREQSCGIEMPEDDNDFHRAGYCSAMGQHDTPSSSVPLLGQTRDPGWQE